MAKVLDYDYNWKSSGVRVGKNPELEVPPPAMPIGVPLPLSPGSERSGIFEMSYDSIIQVRNNFKNLLLTNHNERLGNPRYGANLRPLCTEYSAIENFEGAAMDRIQSAVSTFMPIIELEDFSVSFVEDNDPALLRIDIKIKYNIPKLRSMGNITTVSFSLI